MSATPPDVTVTDVPERAVFVAVLGDGTEAGGAYYRRRDGVVTFTHTKVDPAFEGRGVGTRLAAGALALVRDAGERFVPLCPFIRAYVERHPEFADLRADAA